MAISYQVGGGEVVVDGSVEKLHEYHEEIIDRIDVELHGLVGSGNAVKRVVFSHRLSDATKSDLKGYLKTEIDILTDPSGQSQNVRVYQLIHN